MWPCWVLRIGQLNGYNCGLLHKCVWVGQAHFRCFTARHKVGLTKHITRTNIYSLVLLLTCCNFLDSIGKAASLSASRYVPISVQIVLLAESKIRISADIKNKVLRILCSIRSIGSTGNFKKVNTVIETSYCQENINNLRENWNSQCFLFIVNVLGYWLEINNNFMILFMLIYLSFSCWQYMRLYINI